MPTGSWPPSCATAWPCPRIAIAALLGVRPKAVSKRIRDIRDLVDQAGHPIQLSAQRLANLDDLYKVARSTGIAHQPEIKRLLTICKP